MVRSKAVIEPEVDERKVKRESQKVERALSEAEQLEPRVDTRAMQRDLDKVEGPSFGGAGGGAAARRPGSLGGRGGGGGFGAGMLGGRMSAGGGGALGSLGGAASKAALPVALAGAVGFGIMKSVETVAEASPAFQQQQEMFEAAMNNLRAPFGNAIADALAPGVNNLLEASVEFRKAAEEEGLGPAFEQFAGDTIQPLFEEMATGTPLEAMLAGGQLGTIAGGFFGGGLGAKIGGAFGALLASTPLGRSMALLASQIPTLTDTVRDWQVRVGGIFDDVRNAWPGWPDIKDLWPGWPNLGDLWPGWDSVVKKVKDTVSWPSVDSLLSGFGWPSTDSMLDGFEWPDVSPLTNAFNTVHGALNDFAGWLNQFPGVDIDLSQFDETDGSSGGGGGSGAPSQPSSRVGGPTTSTGIPRDPTQGGSNPFGGSTGPGGRVGGGRTSVGFQRGGIVTGPRQGVVGEAGPEAVLPLDTFLTNLEASIRSALSGSQGGAGGDEVVRELQDNRRELRRTRDAVEGLRDVLRDLETGGSALVSR